MRQLLQSLNGRLWVADVDVPAIREGGALVRNVCSLISAGTERANLSSAKKSLLQRAADRPDLARQVIRQALHTGVSATLELVRDRLESPLAMGYSCAGVVESVGRGCDLEVGTSVACAGGGYAVHAEMVWVPRNLCVALPAANQGAGVRQQVTHEEAAFGAVGAIALQGVRVADPRIGECVVVVGLGLIGLITVQILRAAGCQVIGVDLDQDRVSKAIELGAHYAVCGGAIADVESVRELKDAVARLSGAGGADAVIITASAASPDPSLLAAEVSRLRGRIVVVGDVPMSVDRQTYYDKELSIGVSRSYGPGRHDRSYEERGVDYPVEYVRWTEGRNVRSFLSLVADGAVRLGPLITHRFAIGDALDAFRIISGEARQPHLAVLLTYDAQSPAPKDRGATPPAPRRGASGRQGVSLVGSGSFARHTLLPILKRLDVDMRGVVSTTGPSAEYVAGKANFEFATTDFSRVLDDPRTTLVVIASRHGSHATLVHQALAAGKHVFVEKPLCITRAELDDLRPVVEDANAAGQVLMVGYNRRYAPLTVMARRLFRDRQSPLGIVYRVNAGPIPASHWVNDSSEGGGRIVGEVCHFVDFANSIVGELPRSSSALKITGDSVVCTVRYPDSSVLSVHYLDNGHPMVAKERIEIFGGGTTVVLDDFRRASVFAPGKVSRHGRFARQDKGHRAEFDALMGCVIDGKPLGMSVDDIYAATESTLAMVESLAAS